MTIQTPLAAAGAIALLASGPAFAKAKPERPAKGACSKQADAKKLHGKPRKKFMSDCNKN